MKALALFPLSFSSSCLCFFLVSALCSICFCNQNSEHVLCIPTERLALINLKNNFTNEANRLSSWVGRDCCRWSGVVCDNITGHVHGVHLQGHELQGTISPSLIKLSQLRHLDLSDNYFGYNSIPAFFGSFQNLIYLNLSYTHFSREIPHQLGNLSTLQVLDLRNNYDLYSESLSWLKNLKELRHLDMGGIQLAKASDWFPAINNLSSLLELHFTACGLYPLPNNATKVSFTSLIALDVSLNSFDNNMFPGWIFSLRNLALLNLNFCFISGVNPGIHGGFHSMPSLRILRVSGNTFLNSASLLNGLSSLSNLRLLDVSYCNISSPILGNLQNLTSIEHVDLSDNHIVEEIPKTLRNLCDITILNLQSNYFFGNVSDLLERLCDCESPKLELLTFGDNYLIGQLPERLGKLKNLANIDFANNKLTGTIPTSIGSLSLLQMFRFTANNLSGSIPDTIGGLSSMEFLDLSDNMLNGIVTENHLANLTTLKTLRVGNNKLVFKVNVNNWIPPFNLQLLRADSCIFGPQFPSWIQSQTKLNELDLAYANISDTIPNWFWTTFPRLEYLNLSHNNIQGKLGDVTFLELGTVLDLSNNQLHGSLPGNLSRADLGFLDLSNNNISGTLEQFLCFGIQESRMFRVLKLRVLILANNSMSGVIPDCWMNWQFLNILNLEKNQFSGIIPPSLGNVSQLISLDMDDNRLSGNLPPSLLNSYSLVVIELAKNELTGDIPSPIGGAYTSLRVLSLRSNKFKGKIPYEICHLNSIQILDLANNNLSGNLPTCFTNLTVISGTDISNPIVIIENIIITASLVTKGNTYTYSTILYLVTSLDLSNNKFSGPIPDALVRLLGLRYLNLSHNDLTGRIPNSFSQTGKLESLDLSLNQLDGNIPFSLSQLTYLNWLNVSYNNLVGKIPTGPQLQTFNESGFIGNALCGSPLPACSQNKGEGTTNMHDESNAIDWILVILTLAGWIVGFWFILTPLFLSRQWRIAYYHFLEDIWFKLQNFIFLLYLRLTKKCRSR